MTYAELLNFLLPLSAEQLSQTVRVSGVEMQGGLITQAEVMLEDWWNPSGDGVEPVSAYEEYRGTDDYPEGEPIVMHKGEVWLTMESGASVQTVPVKL